MSVIFKTVKRPSDPRVENSPKGIIRNLSHWEGRLT